MRAQLKVLLIVTAFVPRIAMAHDEADESKAIKMTSSLQQLCRVLMLATTMLMTSRVRADSEPVPRQMTDEQAKEIALKAHANATAMDGLKRFYYQARSGNGDIDSMRSRDELSLAGLKEALDAEVIEKDWLEWTVILAWTQHHAYWVNQDRDGIKFGPGRNTGMQERVWTRQLAYERGSSDKRPARFVFTRTSDQLWHGCLRELAYFRIAPHRFWWATTDDHNDCIATIHPEPATYHYLKTEDFDSEPCDLIECRARAVQFWISSRTGRLRGVLTFRLRGGQGNRPFHEDPRLQKVAGRTFDSDKELKAWLNGESITAQQKHEFGGLWNEFYFDDFGPNELIRFRDDREIAPGVWIPFREDRAFTHGADDDRAKRKYIRLWVSVAEVKTGMDLTEIVQASEPKEGERIQDQRFGAVVDYDFRRDRSQAELMDLVKAAREKREENLPEPKAMPVD